MASKKDFGSINIGSRVHGSIQQATSNRGQQSEASPQEAAARKEEMRTQGRKGVKAERINMAFSTGNYEFIKVMARATGKTMTEFTNLIIEAYRQEHPEIMDQARHFLDVVNSGLFSRTEEAPPFEGIDEGPDIFGN